MGCSEQKPRLAKRREKSPGREGGGVHLSARIAEPALSAGCPYPGERRPYPGSAERRIRVLARICRSGAITGRGESRPRGQGERTGISLRLR
jgi:hypothetical protein